MKNISQNRKPYIDNNNKYCFNRNVYLLEAYLSIERAGPRPDIN